MQKTNLQDVAAKAGVSISTASLALNDSPRIHSATKARVREAAKELSYIPNARARALVQKRTNIIGLVIPDILNSFYAELSQSIDNHLTGYGYRMLLCNTSFGTAKEREYIHLAKEGAMDAIIFACSGKEDPRANEEALVELQERFLPVLLVNRRMENSLIPCVDCDRKTGMYEAVKHLFHLGHREMGFIGGFMDVGASFYRFAGFLQAKEELGFLVREEWILDGLFRPEGAYQALGDLAERSTLPTAFLCCNDQMALGAGRALGELGYKIPEDISLVGFDSIRLASYVKPALSSVSIPVEDMGRTVAENIHRLLQKERVESIVILPTSFVARESSGLRCPDRA